MLLRLSKIERLSKAKKSLLLALTLLAPGAFGIFTVIEPQLAKLSQSKMQLSTSITALKQDHQLVRQLGFIKQQLHRLQKLSKPTLSYQLLSESQSIARITQLITVSGLQLQLIKPLETSIEAPYTKQSLQVNVDGSYRQLLAFIKHIDEQHRLTLIENYLIKPKKNLNKQSLEMEMTISIYQKERSASQTGG